ncbi:hypothetical protein [Haloplanus rubicundus]|uniref:hypothetical protein n=1 Tax=Haloplanus rubicundus TaxID=1547898 RepID=UPI0013003B25|nr:hypothetical protein [Haloplanus rubicundus]
MPDQGGSSNLNGILERLDVDWGWECTDVDEFTTSVYVDTGQAEVGLDESSTGIPADRVGSGFNLNGIDEVSP